MKKKILFVDDSPVLLEFYGMLFHSMKEQWELFLAADGPTALKLMEASPIDVIVSDMHMPGMNGPELFNEVLRRHPKTARIILSGELEDETVAECVGATHQFLAKPCDFNALKSALARICGLDNWLQDDQLKSVIGRLGKLPSLPAIFFQLNAALASPDTAAEDVGDIVASDPAMTAKLLQFVNSAFFGVPRAVSHPAEAVQILGYGTVRSLVLAHHVFASFEKPTGGLFEIGPLWQHSLKCGLTAKRIAERESFDHARVDESFVSGLLHDIGKLALAAGLPDDYEQALKLAQRSGISRRNAEQVVFGTTHAEVGAYLIGLWGLPATIVEAVGLHHRPSESAVKQLGPLTAVHAADVLIAEPTPRPADHSQLPFDMPYLTAIGVASHVETWRAAVPAVISTSHGD